MPKTPPTITTPKRESRTSYLNRLFASFPMSPHESDEFSVLFIPFRGWVVSGPGGRFFGDDGNDDLGATWQEAETHLKRLYA